MISIQNVSKSFGKQHVLRDVSLELEPDKITAVVGPSGVGKSVLLKLIMGILQPDSGRIFVEGKEISAARSEREKNEIRSVLGVLFQSAALFDSETVYENVAFPLRQREGFRKFHGKMSQQEEHDKVCEMLSSLSLESYAHRFPQEVSIGIRKRVGMARALITEPDILLFDEPNTGLDPLVGQEVYDLIKECRERWGYMGVVISHELPEVFQVSDKVAMLLGGQVVFEGSPQQMSQSELPEVQQFLYGKVDGPIKIH